MTLFQFDVGDRARKTGRLVGRVRDELVRALADKRLKERITQQGLAKKLGVHRSQINRQLSGEANLTLRSLADLAWAMNMDVVFELREPASPAGSNEPPETSTVGHAPAKILDGRRRMPSGAPASKAAPDDLP
ncbi:MAG: helix-turn-helix domain-containing protein [Rhizobiales bacterium]|nr:helix-turn-helix domain-containing protein [Hyphomicrobiales bacterium]